MTEPRILRDGDAPGTVVVQLPDGTQTVAPVPLRELLASSEYRNLAIATHLDVVAVCQIAVFRLLQTIAMVSIDLTRLLDDGVAETSKPFTLKRIFFDWPTQDDPIDPMPSAAVVAMGETDFDNSGLGVELDDETADRYGQDTILRVNREARQQLGVVVWCAHKEERRAVRAAFERVFLSEPQDQREGRHVVVPEYYDRVVSIHLDTSNPAEDGPADAQGNEWVYRAVLECTVPQVELVGIPPRARILFPTPSVGPEVEP